MDRGDGRLNKFYVALTFLVIILLVVTFIFSGNQLIRAIVESDYLNEGWDDSGERYYSERFFGLEKQSSIKYSKNDGSSYSSFLTVTTIKTLFSINEEELIKKTEETIIQSADDKNITLNQTSRFESWRVLNNGHKSIYVIYSGNILKNNLSEEVILFGETWNCAQSGTSIICIVFSQITDSLNFSGHYYTDLSKIIGDKEGTFVERFDSSDFITQKGLIFNVKCH